MRCTVCQYYYCYLCGTNLHNNVHKVFEVLCSLVGKIYFMKWFKHCKTLTILFLLLLYPLLLILAIMPVSIIVIIALYSKKEYTAKYQL
jgi:hypothetical protein